MEERDFFRWPFSETELRELLGGRPPSEVFAWRSPSFRALGLEAEGLADEELLGLMLQEPRLLRRPLIRLGGRFIIGADWKTMEKALS